MRLKSSSPIRKLAPLSPDEYGFLSDGVNYWVGRLADIVSLDAEGNYVRVLLCNGQKMLTRGTLTQWEATLPPSMFFPTSRANIINLSHVKAMRAYDPRRFSFVLPSGNEVIMSQYQSVLFRKRKNHNPYRRINRELEAAA